MPNKREPYGSLQRTSLWPCPAWHWFGSIRTSSTFPEGYPVTNIWKPAKTRDQKHCQTLVVKQYWWSNSIYYIPPRRKNYRLAGTKQIPPLEKRKTKIIYTTQFCEFQPLVAFRKRGLHHFRSASIRGVLPNWSTWFRLAPVPRSALSRYVNFMDAWICWVMMVAKSELMWTTRLMTQMVVISNPLERKKWIETYLNLLRVFKQVGPEISKNKFLWTNKRVPRLDGQRTQWPGKRDRIILKSFVFG